MADRLPDTTVEERLASMARRPAPDLPASFVDGLERRLLAIAEDLPQLEERPDDRLVVPVGRPWATSPAAWAAAALIVLAIIVGPRLGGPAGVRLDDALMATVTLPDGTVIEAADGLLLPHGSVIEVDEDGSVRVGEVILLPGMRAQVVDGEIVRIAAPEDDDAVEIRSRDRVEQVRDLTATRVIVGDVVSRPPAHRDPTSTDGQRDPDDGRARPAADGAASAADGDAPAAAEPDDGRASAGDGRATDADAAPRPAEQRPPPGADADRPAAAPSDDAPARGSTDEPDPRPSAPPEGGGTAEPGSEPPAHDGRATDEANPDEGEATPSEEPDGRETQRPAGGGSDADDATDDGTSDGAAAGEAPDGDADAAPDGDWSQPDGTDEPAVPPPPADDDVEATPPPRDGPRPDRR